MRTHTYGEEFLRTRPMKTNDTLTLDKGPIDPGKERERTTTFIQVDGRTSTELNVGARLLGGGADLFPEDDAAGSDAIDLDVLVGDIDLALLHLPAATVGMPPASRRSGSGPRSSPTRRRARTSSGCSTPPGSSSRTSATGERPAVRPVVDVEISQVSAGIDLQPGTGAAARRVDVVAHLDGARVGRRRRRLRCRRRRVRRR